MEKRFSKKRQSIIECLKETVEHPGAEWVYNKLKPQYPDLSLGTVYRNINELKEEGSIHSVAVISDKERFDARTDPHAHLICRKCGKISDVDKAIIPERFINELSKSTDFKTEYVKLQFVGLCTECAEKGDINDKHNDKP